MKKFLTTVLLIGFMVSGTMAFAHERAAVEGLNIVFGGEPEPILTDERHSLVWRFNDAETEELVTDLEDLEAVITYGGLEYGPFMARGSRQNPGTYRTSHIFTQPGNGEVTLSFIRPGSDTVKLITFSFTVHPRSDMEIP